MSNDVAFDYTKDVYTQFGWTGPRAWKSINAHMKERLARRIADVEKTCMAELLPCEREQS